MRPVRVATRASELALAQARLVAAQIEATLGVTAELVPTRTRGDRLAGPLHAKGGKGLFTVDLEEALLDGRADLAVHSAKDLPAELPSGLGLVAVPARGDPRDALVTRDGVGSLAALAPGARVGTGSARRAAQLRRQRPDLEVVPLRGNVPTRLGKLDAGAPGGGGGLDAVILACAGLERLGLAERIAERIDPELMLPAVGQGAIALEARYDDPLALDLQELDDPDAVAALRAERAFLGALGGDCSTPLAALAEPARDGRLRLRGLVIAPDGSRLARAEAELPPGETRAGAERLARLVRERGGDAILAALCGVAAEAGA